MVEARAGTGGTRVGGRTAGEKIKMDTEERAAEPIPSEAAVRLERFCFEFKMKEGLKILGD